MRDSRLEGISIVAVDDDAEVESLRNADRHASDRAYQSKGR